MVAVVAGGERPWLKMGGGQRIARAEKERKRKKASKNPIDNSRLIGSGKKQESQKPSEVASTEEVAGIDEKKVATTKYMIFQTLPEDILMQVAQYSSEKEVWDSVKVRYLGADLV
ncbi:hypothetical protein E3N88_24597 [Mikania micrantha]|uniref:Uncharacterized protein n=1 Tax=Mikania micrantha TaxID=192012 RepID=A0A5N6N2B3_9ASTR|nr:hypothetical protein E3N88_24597 [Mikania micrantha]